MSSELSLKKIGEVTAQVYPDNFFERELERRSASGEKNHSATEALAAYLVGEFVDLYDADSSDEANVARISSSLERSVQLLEKVVTELRRLGDEVS